MPCESLFDFCKASAELGETHALFARDDTCATCGGHDLDPATLRVVAMSLSEILQQHANACLAFRCCMAAQLVNWASTLAELQCSLRRLLLRGISCPCPGSLHFHSGYISTGERGTTLILVIVIAEDSWINGQARYADSISLANENSVLMTK